MTERQSVGREEGPTDELAAQELSSRQAGLSHPEERQRPAARAVTAGLSRALPAWGVPSAVPLPPALAGYGQEVTPVGCRQPRGYCQLPAVHGPPGLP